jgi:hypothetical protein
MASVTFPDIAKLIDPPMPPITKLLKSGPQLEVVMGHAEVAVPAVPQEVSALAERLLHRSAYRRNMTIGRAVSLIIGRLSRLVEAALFALLRSTMRLALDERETAPSTVAVVRHTPPPSVAIAVSASPIAPAAPPRFLALV